ncbi:hypothetical protein QE369_001974 [Agrobacterium larrymoorei]|uniref:Uncharacterized protein n=1 Tax=Agrobacterium larrymoorei TaxID=160699 RepID=A0AAJ2BBU2_9HYPH|nr:hypothetical protein [Agrobacterium larrymoorei]MDR6101777.1 hypothetical protein [Agrobacterium larrymoorei]
MLQFDGDWRFDSPGPIEPAVQEAFRDLINRICGQGQRKPILEHFKARFCAAGGAEYWPSTNERFASEDLDRDMTRAGDNAPIFIETFWVACQELRARNPTMVIPDAGRINRVLAEADAGYQLDPPMLIATRVHIPIIVPDAPPSLDVQAQALINESLDASQRALCDGNGRQAVQEVLWLLETISTAFRSQEILDGSIQGRYFNKIIGELRQRGRGHQEQILQWMMTLHGYLSSPTGGGVRHGIELKEGLALGIDEARLYCNLIRSYLTFLIAEHERLSRRAAQI